MLLKESVSPSNHDHKVATYIESISVMNKLTAREYLARLNGFNAFIKNWSKSKLGISHLISKIKEGVIDPYEILSRYSGYLQQNTNISALTLKQRIVTVKSFLEYYDIEISPRKFKLKVKLPRVVRKNKEALSKEDVIDILNACSDIRLKIYNVISRNWTACQ